MWSCKNVNNTAQKLVRSCPEQKEAFGGYDDCMLQYTSRSIIGTSSNDPLLYMWDSGNASKPEEFNRELKKLVDSLRGEAANGDPLRKYATGSATDPNDQTIYALVQCTPDLSPQDCSDCLTNAYGAMATCPCNGNRGSRQIGPRCNFRYQSYRFFKQVAVKSHSPPPGRSDFAGKDDKSARIVIIIVVSTVSTIILMLCTFVILMKMRKRKFMDKIQSRHVDDIDTAESLQYDLSTIRAATDNFSSANKLGEGGFGPVYKGVLSNGQEVAVKRLSIDSGQGDLEFKNEVLLVARLQHRNLVRLQGFCFDGTERLLVYEFVPNASLDQFLFGMYCLTTTNLIDPMLRGSSGMARDIMRCIHIALLCVQENISDRPTMAAVVLMLSSLSLNLPLPSGPAYYTHNDISSEISLIQEYNSRSSGPRELAKSKSISSSHNEASITELSPR